MASNYQFQQHISKILSRTPNKNVSNGQVIQFKYNAKIENPTDINPLVLVCNPNFNNELHGVNFNYLNIQQVQTLVGRIGLAKLYPNNKALTEAHNKGLPLVKVKCKASAGFYTVIIKPTLTSLVKTPSAAYRTYSLSRVGSIQLIDYDFGLPFDRLQRDKVKKNT